MRDPKCPRCGYDLVGVVASWSGCCPTDGVCSECGYAFAWRDLLVRTRQRVAWLYEHRRGISAGYAFEMLFRALPFWWFWGTVRLHHRTDARRLLLFPVVVFLTFWLGSTACGLGVFAVRAVCLGPDASIDYLTVPESRVYLLVSQFGLGYEYGSLNLGGYSTARVFLGALATVGLSFGMALSLLIARSSRRISRVRADHILRAFSYGLAAPLWIYFGYAVLWIADRLGIEDSGSLQDSSSYVSWGYSSMWDSLRAIAWQLFQSEWTLVAAPLVWTGCWWLFAMRRGFQLRQWTQVYVAGLVIGLVLAASAWMYGRVLTRAF
ncbi:MAG: hypothetical protein H6814_00745 [Phycisphaeraceae bacterium]|nr:hypothetical protein [Phycisphaeraceae bacterium]